MPESLIFKDGGLSPKRDLDPAMASLDNEDLPLTVSIDGDSYKDLFPLEKCV